MDTPSSLGIGRTKSSHSLAFLSWLYLQPYEVHGYLELEYSVEV